MKRSLSLSLVMVVVLALLAGCSSSALSGNSNETKALVIAHGAYPQTLDIQYQSDVFSARPAGMIFEKLINVNTKGEFIPGLAESWEYKNDTTIVFKLRQGVKFHNGDALTSKDVEWSLTRAIGSPNVSAKAAFIDPKKFKLIDDYTIEVGYLYPNASALSMFAVAGLSILPSSLYKDATSAQVSANPIGTGPYKYVSSVNGESVTFVRNDQYWGEPAKIKNMVWKTITENANRTIELETGGASFSYDVMSSDVNRITADKALTLLTGPSFTIQYVCYNTEKSPLNKVDVRRALGMAVDKEAIRQAAYNGLGSVGVGPMVSTTQFSTVDLPVDGFDLTAAKALLTKAGYPNGLKLRIFTNDNQARIDAAQVVQNAWAKIGVTATISTLEYAAYYEAVNSGEYDVCFFGWVSNGDPDNTLYGLYHSSMVGASNYSHTTNAKVDQLLEAGRKELDVTKRAQIYKDLQLELVKYTPATYYWQGVNTHAYTNKLKPIEYTPYEFTPWTWEWK